MQPSSIFIGKGAQAQQLILPLANRHGLIAGATGTGKTVTLQRMAEGFSAAGVPVFMADVKGDLSGISQMGEPKEKLTKRAQDIGMSDYENRAFPVLFWDLFGKKGHPIRVDMEDMGPMMLARLMELNETQEGVLNVAFVVAEKQNLPLIDMNDLRAILTHLSENAKEISAEYGNVAATSIASIQRRLLVLEQQGGDAFFGEPALDFSDMLRKKGDEGYINILAADTLINSPKLYSTFLMWMLSHIYSTFPEVGDIDKPKMVFFFDEAHLLFTDAPAALVQKIEQIVRLIRSKGVGVYFITQNPTDIPDAILGQLGNRVQHALRAFSPRDQKAVQVAAETFRQNPAFNVEEAITQLAVGEALVSLLEANGTPAMVDRVLIAPPSARLGAATDAERSTSVRSSPVAGVYEELIDRESAFELLQKKRGIRAETGQNASSQFNDDEDEDEAQRAVGGSKKTPAAGRQRMGLGETLAKSVMRSVGTKLANELVRVAMKSLLK